MGLLDRSERGGMISPLGGGGGGGGSNFVTISSGLGNGYYFRSGATAADTMLAIDTDGTSYVELQGALGDFSGAVELRIQNQTGILKLGTPGFGVSILADLTVDKILAATGTQSIDFSSGGMIFDSSGDINFNCNNSPFRMNIGADRIRIFGSSGTTGPLIEFREIGGGNYVALKGPNSLGSDLTLTLPSADGPQYSPLQTDGSGNLVFGAEALALFSSASDPSSPAAGWIYYNNSSNKLKFYNGSTWETVTSS